jgi:hypothetical protein
MGPWRFLRYETEDGENLAERWRWYEAQDPVVRAAVDLTLATLRATGDWRDPASNSGYVPEFAELKRQHIGLWEIKVEVVDKDSKKRKFRLAGIWREGKREFILLLACEKSGGSHITAFDLALELKKQYEQGKGRVYEI